MIADASTHIIAHEPDHGHVKKIWKTFWVLLILTIVELGLGLLIFQLDKGDPSYMFILFLKGVICILTLAKAFYIISIFMHLGDEVRSMMLSLAVPSLLFVWFIISFLVDGNSFKNLRNTDAGIRKYVPEKVEHHAPAPVPAEKHDKKLD